MYLHKLSIFGFKSFAKKTELTFSKGLSAIVGPNGCGKTNILDAIRWVIGEQKVKALRSASMRDVIFKGSRDHKPLNMAEVLITIRECKGLLPYDPHADTVVIGRRLYRSGDSEYLINGNSVRLKDIQSVLMGTGIGSSIYALIEQSMIQRILAGGKEDRRELLEEAAGIMKFKMDRKASESKLKSTQTDLDRLEDILGEVRKNVNSLTRQMRRSKDLKRLKEQGNRLAIDIAATRYDRIAKKLLQIEKDLSLLEENLTAAQAHRSELDARRQSLSVERDEREADVSKSGEALRNVESRIAGKEKNLAVNKERSGYVEEGIRTSQNQLENADSRRKELEKEIADYKAKIVEASAKKEELKGESDRLIQKQAEVEREYLEIRKSTAALRDKLNESRQKLSRTDTGIGSMEGQLESIGRQVAEAEQAISRGSGEIEKLEEQMEESKTALEGLAEKHSAAESKLAETQKKIESLNQDYREIGDEVSRLESGISGIKGRLEALKESSAPDSAEEKLDKLISGEDGVLGRVSDAIRPGKLPAAALDRILGDITRGWIVKDSDTSERVGNIIREAGLSAILVVLSELAESSNDNANTPAKFSRLKSLLEGYGLPESANLKAVSADGSYVRTVGIRRIGAPQKGAISFAEEIEKLGADIEDFQNRLEKSKAKRATISDQIESARGDFTRLRGEESSAREELTSADSKRREIEYALNSAIAQKKAAEERLKLFFARKSEIEENLAELQKSRKSFAEAVSGLEKEIAERAEREMEAEEASREWTKKANDAQMKFIQAKGDLEGLEREMERLNMQFRNAEETIAGGNERIGELQRETESLKMEQDGLSREIETLVVEKEAAEKAFDKANEAAREKNEELRKIDVELRDATVKASELDKSVHEKRMEKHEQEMQAGFIRETLKSDYGVEIETVEVEKYLSPDEERKAQSKLERLKLRISDFGGVNPDAEIEYEVQKERFDFLTAQREDLVEAKTDLEKTIRKLNNTARRQFLETFEETRRHFKNIFAELFVGGEADLTLQEGEDVLEADIEISARPPGKRFLMINQLSQGEKALCAVSLVFGLYKVKPSPFCMLDEVDAPLDEANVGRFLRMLRHFTDDTQFILITHNKRTMEATDFLYGITMQEDGISKAISLKISDLVLDFEGKEE